MAHYGAYGAMWRIWSLSAFFSISPKLWGFLKIWCHVPCRGRWDKQKSSTHFFRSEFKWRHYDVIKVFTESSSGCIFDTMHIRTNLISPREKASKTRLEKLDLIILWRHLRSHSIIWRHLWRHSRILAVSPKPLKIRQFWFHEVKERRNLHKRSFYNGSSWRGLQE